MTLAWEQIEEARRRLSGVAHKTPVFHSGEFDRGCGAEVFFKAENLQRAGAFKFRGAYNKLKAETERGDVREVVAFSSGNHAQAVALVSKLLGLKATVVMPSDAPAAKVAATRGYGAEVVFYEREKESRDTLAEDICRERGALLVPPFDDPLIMAGAGTAAAEFLEEIPDLDALVVPVSGGGLIAGSATAARHLRPEIEVYGVEPEAGDDTARSLASGHRVEIPVPKTIADGLRVPVPGKLTFPILQKLVTKVLLVSDEEMIETLSFILERMKILVEPSGVAGAAAVRHRKADFAGRRVGVLLSGGNVDKKKLSEYLAGASVGGSGSGMRRRVVSLALLAAMLSPAGLLAHDFWIEPAVFRPRVPSTVEISLRVGERVQGDPVGRDGKRIVRFVLIAPSGESPVRGAEGSDPAGLARVAEPGLLIAAYRSNNARVDLEAAKFEQYLKEEGLENVIALRARRGESDKPSREAYSRSIKSLLCAGDCVSGRDRAVGLTLELVSAKNPYTAKPGDEMPFRLLWNGKPLEGALVAALPKDEPEKKLAARTDAEGNVSFRLPRGGVWLVKAVHMTRAKAQEDVDWESVWASLTFELPEGSGSP